MIKINLAKKKQASYAVEAVNTKPGILDALKFADSSDWLAILYRVLFPVILSVITYFVYEYYIQVKTDEFQVEVANAEKEKIKLKNELKKYSGFEIKKAELEKIGQTFGLKIKIIEQLIQGKDHTVKSMIALSQSCPKDVWIT